MAKGVGLDAGEYEVKAVEIDGSYRRPRLTKINFERIAQMSGAATDTEHAAREAESLNHVLREGGIGKDEMCLGYPCREAVLRLITVPFTGEDKIRKVIKFEAENEIHSHSVDEMIVDFHVIEEVENETRVMVAAVPKAGLRNTLDALAASGVEPETVDLDTMALYRLADWAGVLTTEDSEEAPALTDERPPVRLVLDVGARSTRILVSSRGHLTDMRALRSGEDAVAQEIAAAKGIDLEIAREAVLHCLSTGTDYRYAPAASEGLVDSEVLEGAEKNGDQPAETALVAQIISVALETVSAAQDRFLKRLRRELMRFLTAVSNLGEIEGVFVTGGGSRMPGVVDVLEDVFGREPEPLRYLDQMQHSLSEEDIEELEPRMAVAVGLALRNLGGVSGFNFRQEDLSFTKSFDRIKLPLAIACMLGLFCACFYGLRLYKDLSQLKAVYGKQLAENTKAAKARRGGERREPQAKIRFSGHLGHLVNRGMPAQQVLGNKAWVPMMKTLASQDTFMRVGSYLGVLNRRVKELQGETGYVKGMELDSGSGVLQEMAEVLDANKEALGRYLVSELEIKLPSGTRGGGRFLRLVVVFRGEGFRNKQNALQQAFTDRVESSTDTAFEKVDDVSEALFRSGVGSYFTIKVTIKERIPVRHSKPRSS